MKIVHAADLHIDSPLRGLASMDDVPDLFATATRVAFTRLIDTCLAERAALLLLAGDVFDGDWEDYRTGHFFLGQLDRLRETKTEVALVYGNHDARLTRSLRMPSHVKVFSGDRPESHRYEALGIAVHGQSFPAKEVHANLAAAYPAPDAGAFNIGLLHTNAGGLGDHENYAPCTVEQLVAHGYEYWALGHVHRRSELHLDPFVVYPGNLQGRHARETGPKGATIVEVRGRTASLEHRDMDVARWEVVEHAAEIDHNADDVYGAISSRLEHARAAAGERPLMVRIRLRGPTRAHRELVRGRSHTREELKRCASAAHCVLEKVEIRTTEPEAEALRAIDPALLALLEKEFANLATSDEALEPFRGALQAVTTSVVKALGGPESRAHRLRPQEPEYIRSVLDHARSELFDRLGAPEDDE